MVPIETKLAMVGHDDAGKQPEAWGIPSADRAAWFQFLRWSWWRTLELCALQAWDNAPKARTDARTLGDVVQLRRSVEGTTP